MVSAMSERPNLPTSPPPGQRNGCLQALAILVGIVLLLPGICAIILAGLDPHELLVDPNTLFAILGMLTIGAGGVALIWWAVRRARH
jgi:hypothetical protein